MSPVGISAREATLKLNNLSEWLDTIAAVRQGRSMWGEEGGFGEKPNPFTQKRDSPALKIDLSGGWIGLAKG
jgi:hypothetical protein